MDEWPPDPEHAAVVVSGWLAKRHRGAEVTVAERPVAIGDGFDNAIVATRFDGPALSASWTAPVVLRINPRPDRFAAVKRESLELSFLADAGYPAPRVLGVIPPRSNALGLPIQVMERVAGRTMLDVVVARAWRAPGMFAQLGELHARLHALPADGWPADGGSATAMADHRLRLVQRVVDDPTIGGPGLARALERAQEIVPSLAVDDPVVCHGDFHPLNVMVDGRDMAVVDWTDAGLGDRFGDVARLVGLLEMAPVAAPSAMQRRLLRPVVPMMLKAYRRGYVAAAGPIDEARIARWRPVHLAHDWARAELTLHESGETRVHHDVVPWLVERFARSLAALD